MLPLRELDNRPASLVELTAYMTVNRTTIGFAPGANLPPSGPRSATLRA
jgi:hypothetical protein